MLLCGIDRHGNELYAYGTLYVLRMYGEFYIMRSSAGVVADLFDIECSFEEPV